MPPKRKKGGFSKKKGSKRTASFVQEIPWPDNKESWVAQILNVHGNGYYKAKLPFAELQVYCRNKKLKGKVNDFIYVTKLQDGINSGTYYMTHIYKGRDVHDDRIQQYFKKNDTVNNEESEDGGFKFEEL